MPLHIAICVMYDATIEKKPAIGHDRDVAVPDVRELVREDALDLPRLEPLPETLRHRDGRVLRVAAGRERVRDVATG